MNIFRKALSFFVFSSPGAVRAQVSVGHVDAGVTVNEDTVLGLSAAWACVNLLAGTVGSLPLMVYRTNANGDRTVAKDHPLYRVLHDSPNFDQTAVDFWEGGAAGLELHGDMFAEIHRLGGQVTALSPIWAATVTRRDDGALRYRWTEDGKQRDEPQENVLHIRGFGGTPLGGLSTLAYGRQVFGLATAVDQAASKTFANGLRPSGVLTFASFLTDPQRDAVETKLQEKYAGAMKAGRPMVLEGGSDWKQLSFSPEDAQMLQSRGHSVEEICRLFGVPPFMVGHNDKASGYPTSLEQQVLMFQKFALRKRLKRIEQACEKQLLTPADRAAGLVIEFNLEGLLRGDTATRFASYQIGLQNAIYLINEVRAWENLPPVEGGDVPRMQMQHVPITEAQAAVALPKPAKALEA